MTDIRSIRATLGLSQVDLADKLGVTQPSISRLESGNQPIDKRTLLALEALQLRAEASARDIPAAADSPSEPPTPSSSPKTWWAALLRGGFRR